MKTIALKLDRISIDGDTQQRLAIDCEVVEQYSDSMLDGAKFPAVVTYHDGVNYWLADGFHRYHASNKAGMLDIMAHVHEGTKTDAQWYSCGANHEHGKRLTNDDKTRSVTIALKLHSEMADNEIAKHCGVSQPFVSGIRNPTKSSKARKEIQHTYSGYKSIENSTHPIAAITPTLDVVMDKTEKPNEYNAQDDTVDELYHTIESLSDENLRLKDAIAVGNLPPAERGVEETLIELRKQVKVLEVSLAAVTISRDTLQLENNEMKKQLERQRSEIKKLKGDINET